MHVKLAPYVLGIIALILISAGVSKSFAFDIVTSPIGYQTDIGLGFSNVNDGGMCGSHYRAVLSYSGVFLEYTANNGRPTFGAFAKAKKISDDLDFLFTYISQCNPYFTGIKSNKLFNKTNSLIYASPYNFFLDGLTLIRIEGDNMVWYTLNTLTMTLSSSIQSINMVTRFGHNVSIMSGTFPIKLSGLDGQTFFAYQGTDGKSYRIQLDTSNGDVPISSAGTGSVLPLGSFVANDLILARQFVGGGSMYIGDGASALPKIELSTGVILSRFNIFQNPVAYFSTSTNTVVKWDLNCKTPYYNSCTLNGGVFKCANDSGTLSPGGELCGGTVDTGPPPSCSDGIKNQSETAIDYGGECGGGIFGTGSCFSQDLVTGRTLLPYSYNGTLTPDIAFGLEKWRHYRSGYDFWDYLTMGNKNKNYFVSINSQSSSGSLADVLVHSTGAFVYYSDSVTSPPLSLDFELYSGTGFSDDETTDFFSTGSNAINYFRVSTDKAWHLDAKLIKNISTASGVYNNVQDAEYTRFDTQSGGIVYLPINEVSRDFKIVFDNSSPIIYSIDWGSYTRTVSSSLVCNSGGTNAVTQALNNIAKYKDDVQTSLVDLDSTDIESSLVNKIKFFMGFLSFSLSDTGNVFSVYLPIGSNLSLSGVSLTIPKTGYSPTNTGALNYFAPVTVGNNKTVVDYIIFIVGLLAYFSGVFTVVYFLVFYIGVFLLSAIQKMFSSVTFNFLGKDDESISGNFASMLLGFTFLGSFLLALNYFLGDFLLSVSSSLVAFRNIFGYLINFFVLSFTSFSSVSFIDFVNGANGLFTPLLIVFLGYRLALKFGRVN